MGCSMVSKRRSGSSLSRPFLEDKPEVDTNSVKITSGLQWWARMSLIALSVMLDIGAMQEKGRFSVVQKL